MRRIIAKFAPARSDDGLTLTDSARIQLMREYAQGLMEPERTIFEAWQDGKKTPQISRELQIDRKLVQRTLARVYADLRVSLEPSD